MTKHKTGRVKSGLRLGWSCLGFESTKSTASRPTRAKRPLPISSEGARRSSSTISCSALKHGRVRSLLRDRGRVQRLRRPPGQPRCDAFGGVAGAAREAAGVQAADGVDVPLGVLA